MKKIIVISIIICMLISCKSYNNFKGYATNDNSECFNDEIFKIKEEEKIFPQKYIDSVKRGDLIKENDIYIYNFSMYSKGYYLSVKSKSKKIIKDFFYFKNGKVKSIAFGANRADIYKEFVYNEQGEIIKDTLYNNYPICWKEALAIAKHRARKEINRFNVTDLYLSGYIDKDSIPKWHVKLMPHGKETLDSYYDYLYYQGGEGKNKGERNIIINANTGAIIKDFRQRIRRIAAEY